jgi:hypothetical protein
MTREHASLNGPQDIATAKFGTAQGASGLEGLLRSLEQGPGGMPRRSLPPVERWNPPFCGEIDMRIAADGQWFYMGTPIGRPKLVRLFASVLVREGDAYRLVTPVEKVGIRVDDAPFQAVEMATDGEGAALALSFRNRVDEALSHGTDNGIRFDSDRLGGLRPYVHVRRNLWARVTLALTYDLLALGGAEQHGGQAMFGVRAGGAFWPAVAASEVEDLA